MQFDPLLPKFELYSVGAGLEVRGKKSEWGFCDKLPGFVMRFGMAWLCCAPVLAACARWSLDPLPAYELIFYLPFYLAVLVMTTADGWKPALLTTFLSAVAAESFFLTLRPEAGSGDSEFHAGMSVFLLVSAVIIGLGEIQRTARRKTESLIAQLQERNFSSPKAEATLPRIRRKDDCCTPSLNHEWKNGRASYRPQIMKWKLSLIRSRTICARRCAAWWVRRSVEGGLRRPDGRSRPGLFESAHPIWL